ncbi:MAG: ROK family protein [Rhodospirillales bacterium]|nr:ROK family protein [Rhodospirillales bacterium]
MPADRTATQANTPSNLGGHAPTRLPAVTVDTYNAELRDPEGFVGDRASKRAFQAILDDWRDLARHAGEDPFGEEPSEKLPKKKIEQALTKGDPEAAAVVHSAIEEFAQELATVIRRFLRLKAWRDTQRIVVGGGLRAGRMGELAISRAGILLRAETSHDIALTPIRHHPDEAGLIGAVHLSPAWIFRGHDAILAVDIGGTNIRCGIVELRLRQAEDLSEARVAAFDLWRHRDEKPTREDAVTRLGGMLEELIRRAEREGRRLAPFVGIGCPGLIEPDGSIDRGSQNLPGNWASADFHLPGRIQAMLPEIDGHEPMVLMHNDAVVQGLSEVPFQTDVERWGVLTIGTGLGNARFTNRKRGADED